MATENTTRPLKVIARTLAHGALGTPKGYEPEAERIITALRDAGFAVVPVEPTEDMLMAAQSRTAGWLNLDRLGSGLTQALAKHKLRYQAMVEVFDAK